jgi:putative ABC transport system substrate-binding protein
LGRDCYAYGHSGQYVAIVNFGKREFLGVVAGLLAASAIGAARSAPGTRPKRVAICLPPSNAPDAIVRKGYAEGFAKHGLVDGKDIEIGIFRATVFESAEDLVGPVRQAVAFRADVIMAHCNGVGAKEFLLPITGDIPLVLWGMDDGGEDSTEALNRRGENVTGALYSYVEMVAKRIELMKALRPTARRVAMVLPLPQVAQSATSESNLRRVQERHAARASRLGLEFISIVLPVDVSPDEMLRALREARIDLVEISGSYPGAAFWEPLARNGFPASGTGEGAARNGALLSGWTVGYVDSAIRQAAKVVRGQRAASIPVERAMEFRLQVNLRTARTLGITVPPSVLVRADKVYE